MNLSKFIKHFAAPLLVLPLLAGCNSNNGNMSDQDVVDAVSRIGAIAAKDNGQILDQEMTNHVKVSEQIYVAHSVDYKKKSGEEVKVSIEYKLDDETKAFWDTKKKSKTHTRFWVKDGANNYAAFNTTLSATVKYGAATKGLTYKLAVSEGKKPVPVSIEEIYTHGFVEGDAVITAGYVTDAFPEYTSGVFIQDGDHGVMLYGQGLKDHFPSAAPAVGTLIELCGFYSPYNGLVELKDLKYANALTSLDQLSEPLKAKNIQPAKDYVVTDPKTQWTIENLKTRQSVKVDISGLTLEALQDKTSAPIESVEKLDVGQHWKLVCKAADGTEVIVYVNYHLGAEIQKAIKAKLVIGATYNIVGGVIAWYNGPQITPFSADQLVKA